MPKEDFQYICATLSGEAKDLVRPKEVAGYDGGGETGYIKKAGKDYTYFDLGRD